MMMRHPRQQLRGSPNQGISHGVQPLPESAHRLHTVKDPLPTRLTRPRHTHLLSRRAADWDRPVPPAFLQSRRRRAVHQDRGCLFASGVLLPPAKNGCVPMRNDSVTSGPNGETRLKSPGRNRGAPRESRDRGDSVPAWNGKLQPAQPHGFEPRTFFEAQGPRIICVKEAGKKQGRGRRLGDWEEITAAGRTSSERGYRGLVYLQLFPRRRKDQRCSKGS